jgi:hypothetical protein
MPLNFTDEEKNQLLELAQPIDQARRDRFLQELAQELEAAAAQTGVGPGPGGVHRIGRVVQRRFFNPPVLGGGDSKWRA